MVRNSVGESRIHRRRREGDRGASLVEFALVAPLLFALLLGAITGGLALSRKNSITNASREGARLGATLEADGAWAEAVRQRVVDLSGGDIEPEQVCVALVSKASATDTAGTVVFASPCSLDPVTYAEPGLPAGSLVGECIVRVWAGRESPFETVFFQRQLHLYASAVARYERDCTS